MFLWIPLLVGVVVLAIWLLRGGRLDGGDHAGRGRALEFLKEHYARGEIDKEEFESRKRDLA